MAKIRTKFPSAQIKDSTEPIIEELDSLHPVRAVHKIPIADINFVAYQLYSENKDFEDRKVGTRVIWFFSPSERFYEISEEWLNNSQVRILDFIGCLKKLRSRMLSLRST